MPRRDLTEERTEQILDALERCVARFGLGGPSLERIAEEAGMKRSILRHYVGNREDIVLAMAERLASRYREQLLDMRKYVGDSNRVPRLLECLFPREGTSRFSEVVLVEALIAEAEAVPRVGELMTSTVVETIDVVRDLLCLEFPDAGRKVVWEVAYGVVGISFNHQSLAILSLPSRFGRAAWSAARALIETLGM